MMSVRMVGDDRNEQPELFCSECGRLICVSWIEGIADHPSGWTAQECWQHPNARHVGRVERDAHLAALDKYRAFADAALLRALAAIVEASGKSLRSSTMGSRYLTTEGLQAEIGDRTR